MVEFKNEKETTYEFPHVWKKNKKGTLILHRGLRKDLER